MKPEEGARAEGEAWVHSAAREEEDTEARGTKAGEEAEPEPEGEEKKEVQVRGVAVCKSGVVLETAKRPRSPTELLLLLVNITVLPDATVDGWGDFGSRRGIILRDTI